MIRHYDIQWHISVRKMIMNLLYAFSRHFPHLRQPHFPIHNLSEKMFTILGADRYEIFATLIIMPMCTGGRYTIGSFEFIVRHNRWILNTIFTSIT